MLKKLSRYYHTIKHLKLIQIRYQIWYRLRSKFFPVQYPEGIKALKIQKLNLDPFPNQHTHFLAENHFQFLNLEQNFKDEINWNYLGHGKLWAYHLNYFDCLHQPEMDWETGKKLIDDFLEDFTERREGLEPYPISLRTINWIKFLAIHQKYPQEIIDSLYAQYQVLTKKLEYHLLGNHLLENGFSLLFGVVFFQDEKLIKLTRKILEEELNEQFHYDGAHFELSPMYHVILLQRALDGYNLLENNEHQLIGVQQQLEAVIQKMVNWLSAIMFGNGNIPMLNDSTGGQGLEPKAVMNYANQLGFIPQKSGLKDSGYRKLESGDFELVADVGEVGPSYQPGHAHSDTLNFVLNYKGAPVIIDRGISTYEKNRTRDEERRTSSHNTVMINNKEQSDVWGGFRVGRRAEPVIITDEELNLKATHTGYEQFGIHHVREWEVGEDEIVITDEIQGNETKAVAYYHLHPDIKPAKIEEGVFKLKNLTLTLSDYLKISVEKYPYCEGFNKCKQAQKLCITFTQTLKTTIKTDSNK